MSFLRMHKKLPFESRRHVLIVDTHEPTREYLMRIIEALGYRAVMASTGTDAINLLRMHKSDPFHLLIVEINMIGVDGVDVVEYLRHLKMETPVILVNEGTARYAPHILNSVSPHQLRKPLADIPAIQQAVMEAMAAPVRLS